jgi:hypothetical protein
MKDERFRLPKYRLLTLTNPKVFKATKGRGEEQFLAATVMMAPNSISGYNVCPSASPGCIRACLNSAGRGKFAVIRAARKWRTKLFVEEPRNFFRLLLGEMNHFIEFCLSHRFVGFEDKKPLFDGSGSMEPCFRLNCTSDIPYEDIVIDYGVCLMEIFSEFQFYDYTKIPGRFSRPRNYHLTYSRHELEESEAIGMEYMNEGVNMAVVFSTPPGHNLPPRYSSALFDHPVIDGSKTDLRFLDPEGHIVGLYPLNKAQTDKSGFVVKARLYNPVRHPDYDREEAQTADLFPDMMEE